MTVTKGLIGSGSSQARSAHMRAPPGQAADMPSGYQIASVAPPIPMASYEFPFSRPEIQLNRLQKSPTPRDHGAGPQAEGIPPASRHIVVHLHISLYQPSQLPTRWFSPVSSETGSP